MNRNEYRRAFIMLRAAAQGYGGHVRLERRTLTGSMYFIVSAPEGGGPLRAALAGQRDGQYYATPLGALSRDRRGQLTLAWQFDPRSVDGRPLEAYAWVAVAQTDGACRVVLTGNVEGVRDLDPVRLERAVCALFADERPPAADIPEAAPDAVQIPDDTAQSDIKIYTGSRARVFARPPASAPEAAEPGPVETTPAGSGASDAVATETMPEMSGSSDATASGLVSAAICAPGAVATEPTPEMSDSSDSNVSGPISAAICAPVADAPEPTPAAPSEPAAPEAPASQTAAQALGLDITRPWPAPAEPLRRLFATQLPAQAAPDGDYVYVAAPMPRGSGYENSLAGLKAQDGRITGLRYALPARYAPQPPAGLEGYRWLGGGGEGWWVFDMTIE